jgi:hypothetical protein
MLVHPSIFLSSTSYATSMPNQTTENLPLVSPPEHFEPFYGLNPFATKEEAICVVREILGGNKLVQAIQSPKLGTPATLGCTVATSSTRMVIAAAICKQGSNAMVRKKSHGILCLDGIRNRQ